MIFFRYSIIFALTFAAFLLCTFYTSFYNNTIVILIIVFFIVKLLEKVEEKLTLVKNLFYLFFSISSLIVYILFSIYLCIYIYENNSLIGYNFIFASAIVLGRSVLLYSGKIKEWKEKYKN